MSTEIKRLQQELRSLLKEEGYTQEAFARRFAPLADTDEVSLRSRLAKSLSEKKPPKNPANLHKYINWIVEAHKLCKLPELNNSLDSLDEVDQDLLEIIEDVAVELISAKNKEEFKNGK